MLQQQDSPLDRVSPRPHADQAQLPPLHPVPPEAERKLAAALVMLAETIELLDAKDKIFEDRLAALERRP